MKQPRYRHIPTEGKEIKSEVVKEYLPFVRQVVNGISSGLPSHMDKEDFVACGVVGLLEAMERFDPSYNVDFKTFAAQRIRGAVLDELRKVNWMPRTTYGQLRRIQQVEQDLSNKLGRTPGMEEVAQELSWSQPYVEKIYNQAHNRSPMSLENLLTDPSSEETQEVSLPGSPFISPEESVEKQERKEILARAIRELPYRDKLVLSLYYKEEFSLNQIAQLLKVSTARVSQLHTRAVNKLRKSLNNAGYGEGAD